MRQALSRLEQLQIPVPPAPNAVGRWDVDHEISAYRGSMGDEALLRQKRLADEAKECSCGKQDEADAESIKNGVRLKKLLGHQHKPGCNSYTRSQPKLAPKITEDEQLHRYEATMADQLRGALTEARERGDL